MEGAVSQMILHCLDGGRGESDDPPLFGWRERWTTNSEPHVLSLCITHPPINNVPAVITQAGMCQGRTLITHMLCNVRRCKTQCEWTTHQIRITPVNVWDGRCQLTKQYPSRGCEYHVSASRNTSHNTLVLRIPHEKRTSRN